MLATNLRRLREDRGWSQRQLGERAGVHKQVIADIEAGKTRMPAYDKFIRIARALKADPDELCVIETEARKGAA